MNDSPGSIEIFRPFGEAWELTQRILFQPFDIGKWFIIAFAAFLANLPGGGGLNFNRGFGRHGHTDTSWNFMSNDTTSQFHFAPLILVLTVVAVGIALVIGLALLWVGARGKFVFVDCLARNRAAIVEPWREYRREGNQFFLFTLIFVLALGLIVFGMALAMFVPAFFSGGFSHGGRHFHFSLAGAALIAIGALSAFIVGVALGLMQQFMVPIMYRQRCGPLEAARQLLGLLREHPVPFVLFVLFSIVLGMAVIILVIALTCVTCCLVAVPYIGTVILLPIYVFLRAFSLCFLRQFGSAYDVWFTHAPEPPPVQDASISPA